MLKEVFPSIKVLSTLLCEYGEGIREQEFGVDPDVADLFNIPRVTGGYEFSQMTKNDLINSILTFGIWTHFVHPDNVFGQYAQGLDNRKDTTQAGNWQEMISSFDSLFSFVRTHYPWLRNMSTKDSYYQLTRYFDDQMSVVLEDDTVVVNFSSGSDYEKYFLLRLNNGKVVSEVKNCKVVHVYPDQNMVVVKAKIILKKFF